MDCLPQGLVHLNSCQSWRWMQDGSCNCNGKVPKLDWVAPGRERVDLDQGVQLLNLAAYPPNAWAISWICDGIPAESVYGFYAR